jgi:hypothetical protein
LAEKEAVTPTGRLPTAKVRFWGEPWIVVVPRTNAALAPGDTPAAEELVERAKSPVESPV